MLLARFRQTLPGVYQSLSNLTISPGPAQAPLKQQTQRLQPLPRLRIGTYNVQSIGSQRQLNLLTEDLRRYRLDILGLQETHLFTEGELSLGNYDLLTLPSSNHRYGIGFAVASHLRPYLDRYWAHSDRVGVLQLRIPGMTCINVITAYSPHSGWEMEHVDAFYADLKAALDTLPRRHITFITGDFNAKLDRRGTDEAFVGPHARGNRNRNGHALATFCETNSLFATNTAFTKPARNKTTWTCRRNSYSIYNQIDYVLCSNNMRRFCTDSQSWGGAFTSSDHKIVTADFVFSGIHRRRYPRANPAAPAALASAQLYHHRSARETYQTALQARLAALEATEASTPQQRWSEILDAAYQAASATVGHLPTATHKRFADPELESLSAEQ